jgi:hypothetical protein
MAGENCTSTGAALTAASESTPAACTAARVASITS